MLRRLATGGAGTGGGGGSAAAVQATTLMQSGNGFFQTEVCSVAKVLGVLVVGAVVVCSSLCM